MNMRQFGPFRCSAIGLGCMNLSHAYGTPPTRTEAERVLHAALDTGYSMLDTAALYGFGANEVLIGKALKGRRNQIILASKCGMFKNDQGLREINGRPEVLRQTCEESLRRLDTEAIDLYYLHRVDPNVPLEESIGALSNLVSDGKIRAIGLSEVSAETLKRAHAVHPISAVQTEYSLWTRNPEIAVLEACKDLGATFVAFSPLGRGYLTGKLQDVASFEVKDIRRNMPRFEPEKYAANLDLLESIKTIAIEEGCTLAQLALAWLQGVGEHIVPIPGTTNLSHLEENFSSIDIKLNQSSFIRLDEIINQQTVAGTRYNSVTQLEIDTEEF